MKNTKKIIGNNFWSSYESLLLSSKEQMESFEESLDKFNGSIFDDVIFEKHTSGRKYINNNNDLVPTGLNSDDLVIELYLLNKDSNPSHKALYKAYIEEYSYNPRYSPINDKISYKMFILKEQLLIRLYKNEAKKFNEKY